MSGALKNKFSFICKYRYSWCLSSTPGNVIFQTSRDKTTSRLVAECAAGILRTCCIFSFYEIHLNLCWSVLAILPVSEQQRGKKIRQIILANEKTCQLYRRPSTLKHYGSRRNLTCGAQRDKTSIKKNPSSS